MSFPYSQETETRMQELYNRLQVLKPQSLGEAVLAILQVFLIVHVTPFYAELKTSAKKIFWKTATEK